MEESGRYRPPGMKWVSAGDRRYRIRNRVKGIVIALFSDSSYACGEHSIMYRLVESLSCTTETNVTFSVNSTQRERKKSKEKKF